MTITVNELKDYILQNSTFANEETIDIVVHDLINYLISNNFDLNNLNVESGETSINFIGDDNVVRLTYVRYDSWGYDTLSDYVSHSSAILQPLFEHKINTGDINYPTILGLKRLQIGNVTDLERDTCYISLREDGYLFNDANKLENFGKDENGNVFLIDYGELIYINDYKKMNTSDLYDKIQYQRFIDRELKYHAKACERLNKLYLEYLKEVNQFQDNILKDDESEKKVR